MANKKYAMPMETPAMEKAEAKAMPKATPKSAHKPGTKKLCPNCNRQMSCNC